MTEGAISRGRIVLVEDDEANRRPLEQALRKNDYEVAAFARGEDAVEAIRGGAAADLVVTDLRLPGLDGLGVLREVKAIDPTIGVLLVTAFGTVESAVEAMKIGADDYLTKPLNLYEVRHRVRALVEKRRLSQEVAYLHARLDKTYGLEGIVGRSARMRDLFDQIRLVAPARTSVLITGESGTGKELIANAIHHLSPRRHERFLALNCSAIPKTLLESELFGHERGAFTGATAKVVGKFELAHRGTLFLDEVGEVTPDIQVKLLRVLEEKRFMRVGGTETVQVDTRILAATNRDLDDLVRDGRFRSDLFYRLKVVTLSVPPLRERPEDIPLLVHHFLEQFKAENRRPQLTISPEAVDLLTRARWAGNARELRNLIESLVVLSTRPRIEAGDIPPPYREPGGSPPPAPGGSRTMDEIERQAILRTLEETGGNRTRAAEILGIGLRTLQRKLKEYAEAAAQPKGPGTPFWREGDPAAPEGTGEIP